MLRLAGSAMSVVISDWVPLNVPPSLHHFSTSIDLIAFERACAGLGARPVSPPRWSFGRRAVCGPVVDKTGAKSWLKVTALHTALTGYGKAKRNRRSWLVSGARKFCGSTTGATSPTSIERWKRPLRPRR